MQPHSPRPAPTPAAGVAELLRAQVAEWVRLAARRPLPASAEGEEGARSAQRLVFVDAFARSGMAGAGALVPAGPAAPGEERAVEAVRALFDAADREGGARHPLEVRAVLVEEDPAHLAALRDALVAAGLGNRVREEDDPARVGPGEVGLVEADFAAVAPALPLLLEGGAQGLVWMAPPSPRRLPWSLLEPLLRLPGADLLVAFPHADLHRQARFGTLSVADLPPHPRRVVEGISALFGDPRHGWLSAWRAAERAGGAAEAEAGALAGYEARLRGGAGDRVVKPVELALPGDAVLHLFHLARDPMHALALNDVLRTVGLEDRRPERVGTAAPLVPEPEGEPAVLEMFGAEEMRGSRPAPRRERMVDVAALADRVATERVGRTVTWRDVLCGLAESDAGADEVRRAMALLRRSGRAVYRSLADDDAPVDFPMTPIPPVAAKRRRTPRDGGAGLLLGLDVEIDAADDEG